MAIFHRATVTPTKEEAIAGWLPRQPWGPPADASVDVVGAFRFDDPEGRVGMETFLVRAAGELFQVPLTYRDAPLDAPATPICEMEHTVLGTRWVYDGLRDPLYPVMLAAVTMTGQGEALGMVVYDGRWYVAPASVRIRGGGWTQERIPVDRFEPTSEDHERVVMQSDRLDLVFWRRPASGERRPLCLTATWEGQPDPVLLAEVTTRDPGQV